MSLARLHEDIAAERTRLVRHAYALTRDAEEASDLAQETLLRAISAAERLRPDTDLRAWLATILNNLYRRRGRRARWRLVPLEQVAEAELEDASAISSVERDALARANAKELARAFGALPAIYADALRRVSVDGLSYAETAERLGVPIGTVMSRVHRGRRLLLRSLVEAGR